MTAGKDTHKGTKRKAAKGTEGLFKRPFHTDSLCHTPETNTTLQINYTPVKIKKQNKKNTPSHRTHLHSPRGYKAPACPFSHLLSIEPCEEARAGNTVYPRTGRLRLIEVDLVKVKTKTKI